MLRSLTKNENTIWHVVDRKKVDGCHAGIIGNVSSISGNVSGIRGDLDDCEITDQEREDGININRLVKE